MTDPDDLPGYLADAFRDALANGLTGLTLWRIGQQTTGWQASSRWAGRDGYSVHIEADPLDAVMAALGAHRKGEAVAAPAAAVETASLSVFD